MDHELAASDGSVDRRSIHQLQVKELNLRKILFAESLDDLCELLWIFLVSNSSSDLVSSVLQEGHAYLRANVAIDPSNQDPWLARVKCLRSTLSRKTFVVLPLKALLFQLVGSFILVLLPLLASLDDDFELKHHSHKLRVLNGGQDPVEADQVFGLPLVSPLAYLEHLLGLDLFLNEELVQLLVQLLHVLLEYSVALELLLICIVFKLHAVLIAKFLEELLEVTLLAEGLETVDKTLIGTLLSGAAFHILFNSD